MRTDPTSLTHLLARIDAVVDGARPHDTVPTGYPSADRILGGGFRRGDLVVLGGDVGAGKSALALAIALRVTEQGRRTAFFSPEMSDERVYERLLAIEGRVRIDDLRSGALDEARRASVGAAAVRLRDLPLSVERLPAGGVPALLEALGAHAVGGSTAALAAEEVGHELVVVDGLQALASGARASAEEVAAAVRALKALALDLDVVLLATAQLPALTDRPDRRPHLDDFGALGAVKQHADLVLALFREGMYEAARELEGATELLVRKNRNGATGYVDLYFYAQWLRFEDMLEPDR